MGNRVYLTRVIDTDIELLMAWRSNPLVYKYFYLQREPLVWENHLKWFMGERNSQDRVMYMVWYDDRRVGSTSLHSFSSRTPEIDIYIGEVTLWGKGVGKEAIRLVIDYNIETLKRFKAVSARIMKGNIRSQKMFEACGFVRRGEGRPGEWYYEKVIK